LTLSTQRQTYLTTHRDGWQSTQRSNGSKTYAKAVKVHAMSASPFDVTVMIDFDFDLCPCRPDFVNPLAKLLNGSDVALTNTKWNEMVATQDYRHWLGEHNSALVVLNMEMSVRARILMGLYVEAFHGMCNESIQEHQMDQPALMVAMRAMADPSPGGPYNQWDTNLRKQHELDSLDHVDLSSSMVCRRNTRKENGCGEGSTCLVSHKPKFLGEAVTRMLGVKETFPPKGDDKNFKIFGIGCKKTGTISLCYMYEHVKKYKAGENSMTGRVQALNSIVSRNDTSLALELADRGQHFQDAPWCNEPQRLHRTLATRHPKAKFALTVRDPDQWHASVTRATACRPGKRQKRFCGDVKLSKHAKIFNAKSTSREDMIAAFESHNSAIRDHFYQELKRPSGLLEMDFADPKWKNGGEWFLFCSFVGLTVDQRPAGDSPHSNKTPAHLSCLNGPHVLVLPWPAWTEWMEAAFLPLRGLCVLAFVTSEHGSPHTMATMALGVHVFRAWNPSMAKAVIHLFPEVKKKWMSGDDQIEFDPILGRLVTVQCREMLLFPAFFSTWN
jgi:hypothetical protein